MQRLYTTLVLVIIALGVAGFVFWRYFYLATINLDPIPTEATITVNGRPIADRTLRVPSGTYNIEVSAPGYRTERLTIKVGIGSQITKRVELVSLPRPKKLIDGPVHSLTASVDRKNLFFERSGVLYVYTPRTDQPIPAVPITPALEKIESVDWSPDFALALLHKTDGEVGLYDFKRYDLLHQEYRPLESTIKQTAWTADGNGFFSLNQGQAGDLSVMKANRAGTGSTRLYDLTGLPFGTPNIQTGPTNTLLLSNPDPKKDGDIILLDTHQRLLVPLTDSGRASHPIFNTDKTRLAYIDNGELVTTDLNGKNKRNLTLRPKAGNYSFIDANNLIVLTPNQVSIINTNDGSRKDYEVFAPDDNLDDLIASSNGKSLYYTYQGTLYHLVFQP